MRLSLLVAFLLTGCIPSPSADPGGARAGGAFLDGAWRLVSAQAFDAEGVLVYDPEVQTGLLVISGDHYSFLWTRTPRPPARQHWAATEEERLAFYGTMIAHAGRIQTLHPDTLRFDALAAKSPEFVGGHETFALRATGDSLVLTAVHAESVAGVAVPFYAANGRQEYVFTRQP